MEILYKPGSSGLKLTVVRLAGRAPAEKIPVDGRNTISRAYHFLRAWLPAASAGQFVVRLRKQIPAGAGLGGGSADAAAFLVGAAKLLNTPLPAGRAFLSAVAQKVGADVPFCLRGGTAIGKGRGEVLKFIRPLPRRRVLIALPRAQILTREAYENLDRVPGRRKNLTNLPSVHTLQLVVEAVRKGRPVEILLNDFQPQACRAHSEMARLAEEFSKEGLAAMSGSGSAFFVLPRRRNAFTRLRALFPGVRIREAHFAQGGVGLGRHGGAD